MVIWSGDDAMPSMLSNVGVLLPMNMPMLRRRRAFSLASLAPALLPWLGNAWFIALVGLYGENRGSGSVVSLRSFSFPSGTRFAKTIRMLLYK